MSRVIGGAGLFFLTSCLAGAPAGLECNEFDDEHKDDCPAGKVCVEQTCRLRCDTSYACAGSERCDGGVCIPFAKDCGSHANCPDEFFCSASGSCQKKVASGSCVDPNGCRSGFCDDAVCCDQACGVCGNCASGYCLVTAEGLDPFSECPATCNGTLNGCWAVQAGQSCTADHQCVSNFCAPEGVCCESACDGVCEGCAVNGQCAALTDGPDADSCDADTLGLGCVDLPCSCDAVGLCRSAAGVSCGVDADCASGACRGGVCCLASCGAEPCWSCNANHTGAGSAVCAVVPDETDPMSGCTGLLTCDGAGACWPAWSGVKQFGTFFNDFASGIATDVAGNVYVAGFTPSDIGGNTSLGALDGFLVAYSNSGIREWTRQFGSASDDSAVAVNVSPDGEAVFVVGWTRGGVDGATNAGLVDLFVVKYDRAGTKLWSRQLGSLNDDYATGIAIDRNGNIFISGHTFGSLDGQMNLGSRDFFLVKYDPDGIKQWTRQLGTTQSDKGHAVAVDLAGNAYVAGETAGGLDGNTTAGQVDAFLVKYSAGGTKVWSRQLGSSAADRASSIATDAQANVYIAGMAFADLDGNLALGLGDLLIAKYSSAGVKQWTRLLGTTSEEQAFGVATDADGSVFVGGYSTGGLDGNVNAGLDDAVLAKYDANGVKLWTRQLGTASSDLVSATALDGDGSAYIAGTTRGAIGVAPSGGADLFVAKYNSNGVLQ